MSAELAIKEIQRFLASGEAEVLCVKGRWGVGKTYAWRISRMPRKRANFTKPIMPMSRYSA